PAAPRCTVLGRLYPYSAPSALRSFPTRRSSDLTPEEFRHAIDGVSRLSQTISSRDEELRELLVATRQTSQIVADRNDDFRRLIIGAGQLLEELNARRDALNVVLLSTRALSQELRTFVADNEEQSGPTLDSLDSALTSLGDHEEDLH